MAITVAVAESNSLISYAIQTLIKNEKDLNLVGECKTFEDIPACLQKTAPDILVISRYLSGKDCLPLLSDIRLNHPNVLIILLIENENGEILLNAMRNGVKGIIVVNMAVKQLIPCIRKVNAGGDWLERDSLKFALDIVLKRGSQTDPIRDNLTDQEERIARFVAKGLSNKEIAKKLNCTEGSVKSYLHRIYTKLDVKNRVSLAQLIKSLP